MTSTSYHPLDQPVWASLTGPHASFAAGSGPVRRYRAEFSPFVAVDPQARDAGWTDLLALLGPGVDFARAGDTGFLGSLPAGWQSPWSGDGVQLIATDRLQSGPDEEAVLLGPSDEAAMLELVERTQPGPWRPQTYRLGTYLGIRRDGALIAMAGERVHPPGFTEISAVCTDPAFRGEGLARRLVHAVADGIRARGEVPFLHAASSNVNAIRLYLAMGFEQRRDITFAAIRTPSDPSAGSPDHRVVETDGAGPDSL